MCAGSVTYGGMEQEVWEGDSCKDLLLPFLLLPFFSLVTGMIRPSGSRRAPPSWSSHFQFSCTAGKPSMSFGMTSSASENAGWADLLQLCSCPVWEDQWDMQKVHFSSLLLKWHPEVPRANIDVWTCLWRVSTQIQAVLSGRSFFFWPKNRCNMICLLLSRPRWEMLSFSIKSSCRFYKIVNSSGSSRDMCPWYSCRIYSCSLKVNHRNTGLVQHWETRPDRCSSHLLFRASSGQEPTTSPLLKAVFPHPGSRNSPSHWSKTSFAAN